MSFEIVDVAGRVVASISGQDWKRGRSAVKWSGFSSQGKRAAPGVYFVRMKQAVEGIEHQIVFNPTGDAEIHLLPFKGSGEAFWGERSEADLEITSTTSYAPTATGYHGVVIVNDNGGTGAYQVGATAATVSADPGKGLVTAGISSLAPNPTDGPLTIRFDLGSAARVGCRAFFFPPQPWWPQPRI